MEKKVFIINKSSTVGGHDFSPAMEYGRLIYLSEGRYSRYDVNSIYREFSDILKESQPEDYILLSGLPIMQAIAVTIMAMKHGKVNILQFKQTGDKKFYIERNLIFNNEEGE